jgi:hypothetical protein
MRRAKGRKVRDAEGKRAQGFVSSKSCWKVGRGHLKRLELAARAFKKLLWNGWLLLD